MFRKFDGLPNGKTDTNNHGAFSTDNIGMNYDYPEASYARRREIIAEHETYQKGLMWLLANDPRVPEPIRTRMSRWGLAADEFVDNGHWPHQLYIREARRMVSDFVLTENHLRGKLPTSRPIGLGSYNMDSHNVQRYVGPDGRVRNEGDIQINPGGPYAIDYGAIVPKAAQCENLLVPVCLSSSHIAYGSVRMEPVFMILGQSAATAAAEAIDAGVAVQQVDYATLRKRLLADGQVLDVPARRARPARPPRGGTGLDVAKLPGVVVDEAKAVFTGTWTASSAAGRFVGSGYRHDGNAGKGQKTARFEALLDAGRYEVRLAYSVSTNRATNVPVTIRHAGGQTTVRVDQRRSPPAGGVFVSLGTYRFAAEAPAAVIVGTAGTDGYVIADAVQFLPAP